MAEIRAWCLVIDRSEKLAILGDAFSVKVHPDADVGDLREQIVETQVDLSHVLPRMLTVWRCLDPKLLSTMNRIQLGRKLRDVDLTDETKARRLAAKEAVKELGLSHTELLLVELPGAFSISILVGSGIIYQGRLQLAAGPGGDNRGDELVLSGIEQYKQSFIKVTKWGSFEVPDLRLNDIVHVLDTSSIAFVMAFQKNLEVPVALPDGVRFSPQYQLSLP